MHNLLDPSRDLQPEAAGINSLVKLIQQGAVKEVIIALASSYEAMYTSKIIKQFIGLKVKVSKLRSGIPFGAQLDNIDKNTFTAAFKDRTLLDYDATI